MELCVVGENYEDVLRLKRGVLRLFFKVFEGFIGLRISMEIYKVIYTNLNIFFYLKIPPYYRCHLMGKDAVKTSYRVPTDSFPRHLINNLTNFLVMMKRIIVAGLALAVLAACNKDEPGPSPITDPIQEAPVADFDVTVNAYGIATFTNKSTNAIAYRWDFGDNRSSDRNSASVEENPTFTYTRTGTYTVTLSASNGYEVDVTSKEVVYSR